MLLTAAATAAGGWAYARHQWQAARDALAGDRPQEARARLTLPLAVWGSDPGVQVLAARAARLSGDLPAAEAHLRQALRAAGGATQEVQLEFLLLRIQTGEVDQVAPPLLEVVERGHPEGPLILSTLAVAYMNNLRYRPAYACLSRWLELRPDAAAAYQYRGWVLERMNRPKEAMADYRKALDLAPDLLPVRLQVASMLLEDNKPGEALPHLERLYRQAPDDPLVQARLGACRFLRGELADARRLLEAAAERLPRDPPLQIHLARLDLEEGRAAAAEWRLRAVVEADPSDTEGFYALANALQAQGRAEEAAGVVKRCERAKVILERTNKLLRDGMEGPHGRAADCAELGRLLLEVRQDQRGVFWLYEALERDPGNREAHRALADYYGRKGEAAKAASHAARAAPDGPGPQP